MKKSTLYTGLVLCLLGAAFFAAAALTETRLDGLLSGLGGGSLGAGISFLIRYFYWTDPRREEKRRALEEAEEINVHDELLEKLRDRSGRISYNIGLWILCGSMILFTALGSLGYVQDYKIFLLYLGLLLLAQIITGICVFNSLLKRYD